MCDECKCVAAIMSGTLCGILFGVMGDKIITGLAVFVLSVLSVLSTFRGVTIGTAGVALLWWGFFSIWRECHRNGSKRTP